MDHGRTRRACRIDVHDRRQRLIRNVDQSQRGFGDVRIDGRHHRNRLADPEHLVARDVDLRDHPHVVAGFAHRNGGADRHVVEIGRGDDRLDAGQRGRARRIDARDLRVRVRAAQRLGVQHAGQHQVGWIERRALDAFAGIDARRAACRQRYSSQTNHRAGIVHDRASPGAPAAAEIARTIFS